MNSKLLPDFFFFRRIVCSRVTAAAKSLQSCLTLCDPIDSSPPGSPVPGILQARTLEWVAISFSSAWKWKVKVKSLVVSDSSRPHGLKPTRLLHPWDFPGKSIGVGCHCLLQESLTHVQIFDWPSLGCVFRESNCLALSLSTLGMGWPLAYCQSSHNGRTPLVQERGLDVCCA